MLSDSVIPPEPVEWILLSPEEKQTLVERKVEELLPTFMHPQFRRVMGQQAIAEYDALLEFMALVQEAIRRRIPSLE